MKRGILEVTASLLLLLLAGIAGAKIQERKMRAELDAVRSEAVRRGNAALAWKAQYEQVYPLVAQWRMGYEGLKKRCGE